jgi:hypothetical protein
MSDKLATHRVSKHPLGMEHWYVYRGVTIKRDDRVRGYWGHWRTDSARVGMITTATRALLLQQIDAALAQEPK